MDFQRPVVISQVATQGARQLFHSQFVEKYSISYSNDRRGWIFYKGDSRHLRKVGDSYMINANSSDERRVFTFAIVIFSQVFSGNQDAYEVKTNTLFPPVIGRFIRLHPIDWYNKATVRMELYGCELDGEMECKSATQ